MFCAFLFIFLFLFLFLFFLFFFFLPINFLGLGGRFLSFMLCVHGF